MWQLFEFSHQVRYYTKQGGWQWEVGMKENQNSAEIRLDVVAMRPNYRLGSKVVIAG